MQRYSLTVTERANAGKGVARKLRADEKIPAVLYGEREQPIPLYAVTKDLLTILRKETGENFLLDLTINNEDGSKREEAITIVRDLQTHPISGRLMHIDFLGIAMDKVLHTKVPVKLNGTPEGVMQGGVLGFFTRELEIACLPTDIPDVIEIDIEALEIGDSINVASLQVSEAIKVLSEPSRIVALVSAPTKAEVVAVVEGAEGEEGTEGEEGAEGDAAEESGDNKK